MALTIAQLLSDTAPTGSFVTVQYDEPAQPRPGTVDPAGPTPVPSRLLGRVMTPSCELRLPDDNAAGIHNRQLCTREMRGAGASVAAIDTAYRTELVALDRLVARASRGEATAHNELVRLYARHYALMPSVDQPEAQRQRDYTARLDRYVATLMSTDRRQYPVDGDVELAFNWAVTRNLGNRLPSAPLSPADANTLAWLANSPSTNLVAGLAQDPRLVPWLAQLHANPGTDTATVQSAWRQLPGVVATSDNFNDTYRATRAALPPAERAAFARGVTDHLNDLVRTAMTPENQQRWPGSEARLRAQLRFVAAGAS